jgi:hypothetical protein
MPVELPIKQFLFQLLGVPYLTFIFILYFFFYFKDNYFFQEMVI